MFIYDDYMFSPLGDDYSPLPKFKNLPSASGGLTAGVAKVKKKAAGANKKKSMSKKSSAIMQVIETIKLSGVASAVAEQQRHEKSSNYGFAEQRGA